MNECTNQFKELASQQITETVQNLCPCSAPGFSVIPYSMDTEQDQCTNKRKQVGYSYSLFHKKLVSSFFGIFRRFRRCIRTSQNSIHDASVKKQFEEIECAPGPSWYMWPTFM